LDLESTDMDEINVIEETKNQSVELVEIKDDSSESSPMGEKSDAVTLCDESEASDSEADECVSSDDSVETVVAAGV